MNIVWDNVFLTGKIKSDFADNYEIGSTQAKAYSCATALGGWANCMSGNSPPEKFGDGMLALARYGDIDAATIGSPEKISELAKKLGFLNSDES